MNLRDRKLPVLHVLFAGITIAGLSGFATANNINFAVDPFEGTTVLNTPGRQVVGGELFIAFHPETEQFVFDGPAFGMTDIRFANGVASLIPADVNVIVLETTDNDNNPLTPFGAGNAADLIASRVTTPGPGLFIYFNSSLNLLRLVYSTDLSSNTADLRILARMLNLDGQAGLNALPTFSASNFAIRPASAVPEPANLSMMLGGLSLVAVGVVRRRSRTSANQGC